MAIGMFAIVAPLQLLVGDLSGKEVLRVQPAKLAAIEAFWDTRSEQPFHIVAWPDRRREQPLGGLDPQDRQLDHRRQHAAPRSRA